MMNAVEVRRLRSKIETKLNALERAMDSAKSEVRTSSEINANALCDELDFAKRETDLTAAVEVLNRSASERECLLNALRRMGHGNFGLCLRCKEEIGARRLEAHPGATLCLECQKGIESPWLVDIAATVTPVVSREHRAA